MKKLFLILLMMFISLTSFGQDNWKDLYKDKKIDFFFDINRNNLYIKVSEPNFEVKKEKKLDISTEDYGYISVTYVKSIKSEDGDFIILVYYVSDADKIKLSKSLSEDILLYAIDKIYFMKIDSLTYKKLRTDFNKK